MGEHGLPGPGLTRDRVQALAEAQLGPLDQQQIFDSQLAQHRPPCLATGGDGIALASAQCASTLRTQDPARQRSGERDDRADQQDLVERRGEGHIGRGRHLGCELGGAAAVAAAVPPLATASASSGGAAGIAAATFESMLPWKTAPSAATPVAIPTWRNVVLMPDAIPAVRCRRPRRSRRSRCRVDHADPGARRAGSPGADRSTPSSARRRASAAGRRRRRSSPTPISSPAGIRFKSRAGERRDEEREQVSGRKRTPASSGE